MYFKIINPISRLILLLCLSLLATVPAFAQDQEFGITKTAAETNVNPGELIHYLIEPELIRGNVATDIVVTDQLPAATS